MNKIDKYIFSEIIKGSLLIFFIFLSISWLLQFARLISLTNLIQVDIITILYLSIFLVPNLITIILPFVIIFGLVVTFIKLHKDKEIISIYSLGLNISSILKPLLYFSGLILSILILFNFYLSPKIYKEYKIKEYEIRNKINFEKITVSNFIEINDSTFLDFKKENQKFTEVFIKFSENNENMIYAEEALIIQKNNFFIFELINGFKITIMENNEIEKLEFDNYSLKIHNNSYEKYNDFDKNTLSIFDDIEKKNYTNIFYKFFDSFIVLLIVYLFYINNIKNYNFEIKRVFIFIFLSSIFLVINQILKNLVFNLNLYIFFIFILVFLIYLNFFNKKRNA